MTRRGALTTDLVRQSLDQAGRFSPLDRDREADLVKRYRAGGAADQALRERGGRLTSKPATTLRRTSEAGARAKEGMVQANLRLVIPRPVVSLGRTSACSS